MRSPLPLEELGLLCLLEKIGTPEGDVDGYARFGLQREGLVTNEDPPKLSEKGAARLAELRLWRAELDRT